MSVRPAALVHIHNSKGWGVDPQKSRFSDSFKPLESIPRNEIDSYRLCEIMEPICRLFLPAVLDWTTWSYRRLNATRAPFQVKHVLFMVPPQHQGKVPFGTLL